MSLLDGWFNAMPSLGELSSGQAVLQRSAAALQARVGVFLQQKQRLFSLETRASNLSKLDKTSQQSLVLMSRTKALESSQVALEQEAVKQLSAANNLKTELETSPLWAQLRTSNWSALGTTPVRTIQTMLSNLSATGSTLADVLRRVNSHIDQVDALEREIISAEDYAQGKGLRGVIENTASAGAGFYKDMFGKPLMIVAAVGAAAFFFPQIMAGLTGGARRAARNPHGRRR